MTGIASCCPRAASAHRRYAGPHRGFPVLDCLASQLSARCRCRQNPSARAPPYNSGAARHFFLLRDFVGYALGRRRSSTGLPSGGFGSKNRTPSCLSVRQMTWHLRDASPRRRVNSSGTSGAVAEISFAPVWEMSDNIQGWGSDPSPMSILAG